jgi:hypothetical protein
MWLVAAKRVLMLMMVVVRIGSPKESACRNSRASVIPVAPGAERDVNDQQPEEAFRDDVDAVDEAGGPRGVEDLEDRSWNENA